MHLSAPCRQILFIGIDRGGDQYRFEVAKGSQSERRSHKSMDVVVSAAGLEELLSPSGFALAGVLEGLEVHVYFQGPAVRALTASFKPHLGGLSSLFSSIARKGLESARHLGPQDKTLQIQMLGGQLYACGPLMEHFKVGKGDIIFEDVVVCEYLTFTE